MMKGWHNESYRHYLASKGISTKRYFARQRALTPQEFQALLQKEKPMGAYSRAEITLAGRPKGRKSDILREEDYLQDLLTSLGHDPDLEIHQLDLDKLEPHVARTYLSLDALRQEKKRITGLPAYKDVTGEKPSELREGLYEAHVGTSSKKSEKLRTIIGASLEKPESPIEAKARELNIRARSREAATLSRIEPILEEQAVEAAILEKPVELTLADVSRGRSGRKLLK